MPVHLILPPAEARRVLRDAALCADCPTLRRAVAEATFRAHPLGGCRMTRLSPDRPAQQLRARTVDAICRALGTQPDKITDDAHWIDDLGGDSLDGVEIVMEIETEFGIEFTDAEMEGATTLGAALQVITTKLGVAA